MQRCTFADNNVDGPTFNNLINNFYDERKGCCSREVLKSHQKKAQPKETPWPWHSTESARSYELYDNNKWCKEIENGGSEKSTTYTDNNTNSLTSYVRLLE